jgi:hypothetical protein
MVEGERTMNRRPVTDDDLTQMRETATNDLLHEIHLRDDSYSCTCNWSHVIRTREPGWSGTWCFECSLREEIIRLRALITEWADAHDELEDTGYWTDRYCSAGENLANVVGRDFKQ